MFWKDKRAWLMKLLRQRIKLSAKGYMPELGAEASELLHLIEYHGYRSDRLLAGFICRKADKLKPLIPNNNAYESQVFKLETALGEAQKIVASTSLK